MLTIVCVLALGHLVLGQSPQVTTSQGTMKGQVLKSRDGRDYFSFTKIPYAKPPVGERRFVISEKSDNWTGILDATQPTPICFQPVMFGLGPSTLGQEDCLYLNVFTPNMTGKLPVIFAIHGGAFTSGSAGDLGTGRYFMDEEVVLVTINYRLGILGFLSLGDNVIPGNMGLKDQALALEWVHREISAFGGDPNMITVSGESAGGASSHLICEAPRTNGLIKGCVSQSGDGWTPFVFLKSEIARHKALNLAKGVGCNATGNLLQCLQSKPIELIGNVTLLHDLTTVIADIFPVLEPENAPGALLTSWPTKAKNHNYPWIVGVCQDEGLIYTLAYEYHLKSQQETEYFINIFNETIITELHLENRTSDFLRARQRFFTNGVDPLISIRNFMTEYLFLEPALKGLSRHPGPTYFFKFNYTQGPPLLPIGHLDKPAAPHASELPYFYDLPYNTSKDWPKPEDVKLSKLLVKMLANFAKDQAPSSQDTMQWPQFQGQNFLDIQDSGVSIGKYTQYQEILDFWKSILPNQPSKSSTNHSPFSFITFLSIFTTYRLLFF